MFFPKVCYACGEALSHNQVHICSRCYLEMPQTHFWKNRDSTVPKKFWSRVDFQKATSFLHFHSKGRVQRLVHHFKYKSIPEIGITLGEWAASELQAQAFFEGIDLIVPIPIHDRKRALRGYNQSDYIAEGIANVTGLMVRTDSLKKQIHTSSQTRKSKYERWENVKHSFQLSNERAFENKHILLVDDVLTTGATVEASALAFCKVPNHQLSLLTMALTY